MMAETTDVEVELYEENVGTPYSTSDEMDNYRTVRMQVPFKEPTHNSLYKKLHLNYKSAPAHSATP